MAQQQGAVIQNADGSMYFIRQEILDACRVQPDEVADTERMLQENEGEVSGFSLATGPIASVTPVTFSNVNPLNQSAKTSIADLSKGSYSTVMCCW